MNHQVLIVIDMINDFVYGKFGNSFARSIIPVVAAIIQKARIKGIPVIYLKDEHHPADPETSHWGEHALKGEIGSQIIKELEPHTNDLVIPKTTYSGFFQTQLEQILKEFKAREVVLVGVSTNICVQHNAADSFFRGLKITVVEDATAAFTMEFHQQALSYMKEIYGVSIIDSKSLIKEWDN